MTMSRVTGTGAVSSASAAFGFAFAHPPSSGIGRAVRLGDEHQGVSGPSVPASDSRTG